MIFLLVRFWLFLRITPRPAKHIQPCWVAHLHCSSLEICRNHPLISLHLTTVFSLFWPTCYFSEHPLLWYCESDLLNHGLILNSFSLPSPFLHLTLLLVNRSQFSWGLRNLNRHRRHLCQVRPSANNLTGHPQGEGKTQHSPGTSPLLSLNTALPDNPCAYEPPFSWPHQHSLDLYN